MYQNIYHFSGKENSSLKAYIKRKLFSVFDGICYYISFVELESNYKRHNGFRRCVVVMFKTTTLLYPLHPSQQYISIVFLQVYGSNTCLITPMSLVSRSFGVYGSRREDSKYVIFVIITYFCHLFDI